MCHATLLYVPLSCYSNNRIDNTDDDFVKRIMVQYSLSSAPKPHFSALFNWFVDCLLVENFHFNFHCCLVEVTCKDLWNMLTIQMLSKVHFKISSDENGKWMFSYKLVFIAVETSLPLRVPLDIFICLWLSNLKLMSSVIILKRPFIKSWNW